MINNFQARIRVITGATKKKIEFERILNPEDSRNLDLTVVTNGLRMIFPSLATISIEVYGI